MTDTFFGSTGHFTVRAARHEYDNALGHIFEHDVSITNDANEPVKTETITYYDFEKQYYHPYSVTLGFDSITDCAISLCNNYGTDFDRWTLTFHRTGKVYTSESAPTPQYSRESTAA